jgi:hypothetical protein
MIGLMPSRRDGAKIERVCMNSRERAQLRTRLRQVNMEYSALIRNRSEEGRFVRIAALKIQRRAIMSLLFTGEHRVPVARQQLLPVAVLHVAE